MYLKKDYEQVKGLLEELILIPVDHIEIAEVLKLQKQEELEVFLDAIKIYSISRHTKVIKEYFTYL